MSWEVLKRGPEGGPYYSVSVCCNKQMANNMAIRLSKEDTAKNGSWAHTYFIADVRMIFNEPTPTV